MKMQIKSLRARQERCGGFVFFFFHCVEKVLHYCCANCNVKTGRLFIVCYTQ